MALPLKSGADLYNNQALRLRLHNLGADPTEVGAGLIYFNTSTGLNTSQKARLYTGSAWKTIAFSEDLDVAKNEDFLALQRKVDLLSGDVDTDAIINNMKEVSAFLEGFAEDASLMDLLNGKLNTSGGTINGTSSTPLLVNSSLSTCVIGFQTNKVDKSYIGYSSGRGMHLYNYAANAYFGVKDDGTPFYNDYTILTSAGGTIEGNYDALTIKRNSSYAALIRYSNADGVMGYLGFSNKNIPAWYSSDLTTSYTLIHSGNVGEYAVKGLNIQTSSDNTRSLFSVWRGNTDADGGDGYVMDFNWNSGNYKAQIYIDVDPTHKMALRQCGNDGIWSDWKTIAFTDSDITGNASTATALKTATGFVYAKSFNSDKIVCIGADATYQGYKTYIDGVSIALRYGDGNLTGILLNSSGNVTIGAEDKASSVYKLCVNGDTNIGGNIFIAGVTQSWNDSSPMIYFSRSSTITGATPKLAIQGIATGSGYGRMRLAILQDDTADYTTQPKEVVSVLPNGNVLIGTTDDHDGEKVQIKGDLYVEGNLIVDKEVSAGGSAEEGGNTGGGGAFHSESIAVGATQTTIAHGLGTDDIVVSIYEKDGVSGRWSIILTDVEIVDANNIIVSFGSATSVEHKVVIMGAVA